MAVHEIISLKSSVKSVTPDHIVSENSEIVALMEAFMEYMETDNKSGYYLNAVDQLRDIDIVPEEHLGHLQSEVGSPVPRIFAADPRILYKSLVNLYRARGTKQSIEDFFNILYNDEVEIYYPKDDLLIPSDGNWNDQKADTIENPGYYSPILTYTLSAATSTLSGTSDEGYELIFDNPLVYVNDAQITDFKSRVEVNTTTNKLDYFIDFDSSLSSGDVIEIRRSGSYSTANGFLSDRKYVQDSKFYQKFSYVLRTGQNADKWKSAFTRLVHPGGFIFFGEILISLINSNEMMPYLQPGKQIGGLPIIITIGPVDAQSFFLKTHGGTYSSFYEISFKQELPKSIMGPKRYFEQIKFHLSSPVGEFPNYTFEDAINRTINVNMSSQIEISN